MRRVLFLIVAVACFLFVRVESAYSCSCAGSGGPCESYGSASAVFVGTVVGNSEIRVSREVARKEDRWYSRVFKFSVEQAYLGVNGSEIEIYTGSGGGDCGYEFKNGQRYLVYAYRYSGEQLTTSICTSTKPFSKATEDLAFLGNLSSAAPGVTIQGQVIHERRTKQESKPIDPGVSLTIEGDHERRDVTLDEQGKYRVSGLRPGKFKVKLGVPETLTTHLPEREVNVADRGCATVNYYVVENGKVSGRVFDVAGQPVAKILVSLIKPDTEDPTNYVKLVETDEEGRYSFSAIPEGRYTLAVNFGKFRDPNNPTNAYPQAFYPGVLEQIHAEPFNVELGIKGPERDVRLLPRRPPSVVEIEVVWADGTPMTGAFVSAKDVTYRDANVSLGIAAVERGIFNINGYIGQKLLIEARSNQVRSSSEPVRITLARSLEPLKIVVKKL